MKRSEWHKKYPSRDHAFLAAELWGTAWLSEDKMITADEQTWLDQQSQRLAAGEPLAYILGSVPFYGCEISVTPDVLIPRPATEQMVDLICQHVPEHELRVLDLCTGSGCIAVALKKARPSWHITAVDKSVAALAVAARNAVLNGVDITLLAWDITTQPPDVLQERWDLIISNPPYVSESELASEPSLSYEPKTALVPADSDATSCYRHICRYAAQWLKEGGQCWLEHGHTQRLEVIEIHNSFGLLHKACYADYQGHDRIVVCSCSSS